MKRRGFLLGAVSALAAPLIGYRLLGSNTDPGSKGRWTHAVAEYEGGNLRRFYVDGLERLIESSDLIDFTVSDMTNDFV